MKSFLLILVLAVSLWGQTPRPLSDTNSDLAQGRILGGPGNPWTCDGSFNGLLWKLMKESDRLPYLQGLAQGTAVTLMSEGWKELAEKNLSSEAQSTLTWSKMDYYFPRNIAPTIIAAALDDFYRDERNQVIGIPQAVILIGMKLKGMDGFAWERRASSDRDIAKRCKFVDGKLVQ